MYNVMSNGWGLALAAVTDSFLNGRSAFLKGKNRICHNQKELM
jgi:hypothetical protein